MRYEIEIDQDPPHPRKEWDNLGTIVYASGSRYILGDRAVTPDEARSIADNPNNIALPVYAYIHGGISLSTSGFSCPWDSGQCGVIYVSKDKVRREWKRKRITAKLLAKVVECLEQEIKTFDDYLNGNVYGFVVYDDEGENVDSCWGFYGRDYCEDEAKQSLAYHEAQAAKRGVQLEFDFNVEK